MRVLITGGHGFVGRHTVPWVRRAGHHVYAPTHNHLDLMNAFALERYCTHHNIEAIVHLAAICGGIGINKDNPGLFLYHNLQMGVNVIETARKLRLEKVVNLGTVCAYPKHTQVPFREEDIWNGYPEETNAPYGLAKKMVMEMGIAYSRQYDLNVVNLVPVNMAGEHDNFDPYSSHVIPALIRKFQEAEDNELDQIELWGDGSASREFLYAGDCGQAITAALDCNPGPDFINLGTGKEITIRELAELIRKVGEYYDIHIEWDTSKPNGQPRRCLNVSRAAERLSWTAQTPIEQTLKRTLDWFRRNKHGLG